MTSCLKIRWPRRHLSCPRMPPSCGRCCSSCFARRAGGVARAGMATTTTMAMTTSRAAGACVQRARLRQLSGGSRSAMPSIRPTTCSATWPERLPNSDPSYNNKRAEIIRYMMTMAKIQSTRTQVSSFIILLSSSERRLRKSENTSAHGSWKYSCKEQRERVRRKREAGAVVRVMVRAGGGMIFAAARGEQGLNGQRVAASADHGGQQFERSRKL
jgi:hypothetical protein